MRNIWRHQRIEVLLMDLVLTETCGSKFASWTAFHVDSLMTCKCYGIGMALLYTLYVWNILGYVYMLIFSDSSYFELGV